MTTAMRAIEHRAPGGSDERILLILLPGVNIRAEDFAGHGIVQAVRERGGAVDVLAVEPDIGLYLDGTFVEHLQAEIVLPAQARGYRRLWLAGISLGGLGAMLFARRDPQAVEGVILLAPFLGTTGMIAEIADAGGFSQWQPGQVSSSDTEREFLAWLKSYRAGLPGQPRLLLGFARQDRFAGASRLLAERLPAEDIVAIDGAHDWPAWSALWRRLLGRAPFGPAA